MKTQVVRLLIVFIMTFFIAPTYAQNLTCSQSGTELIFINGVLNKTDEAASKSADRLYRIPQAEGRFGKIDKKGLVNTDFSYNASQWGGVADFFESGAQTLNQSFNIPRDLAFQLIYGFIMGTTEELVKSILVAAPAFAAVINSIWTPIRASLEKIKQDAIQSAIENYTVDLTNIQSKSLSYLKANKKVIIVSHSQGNLFANDWIKEFKASSDYSKFEGLVGNLQVASPAAYMEAAPYADHITNSKDWINVIWWGLPSNHTLSLVKSSSDYYEYQGKLYEKFESDPRPDGMKDITYHGFLETYFLNNATSNSALAPFYSLRSDLLDRLQNVALKLASNCDPINATFTYTKSNLTVDFDATDPDNPDAVGLTYIWNFGDGTSAVKTTPTTSHTYSASGTYNVTLIVSDDSGAGSDSTSSSVILGDYDFTYRHTNDKEITFSVSNPDENLIYWWTFGDGEPDDSGENITHLYSDYKIYSVGLTIFDADWKVLGTVIKDVDMSLSCRDKVTGSYNINSDGSIGGFVAMTAQVSDSYIARDSDVCGNSVVSLSTVEYSFLSNVIMDSSSASSSSFFDVEVNNNSTVFQSFISNSGIRDNSHVSYSVLVDSAVTGSTVSYAEITAVGSTSSTLSYLNILSARIIGSTISDFEGEYISVTNSTVSNSEAHYSDITNSTVSGRSLWYTSVNDSNTSGD